MCIRDSSKIVAVPGARYEGNEDGRGGYGALQYQSVMDQVRPYNTDPNHPMLVLLHHDGDNGDAEFKKWLGDPSGSGWSPDRNSWAVLTAAKNRVFHAEDIAGPAN